MRRSYYLPIRSLMLVVCFSTFTSADPPRTIALHGQPTPGIADTTFGLLSDPVINNAGRTAFKGVLSSGVKSVWFEDTDGLSILSHSGLPAPGTLEGVSFSSFGFIPPRLNDLGVAAFAASLTGPGIDNSNKNGFWLQDEGTLSLVARTGDQAPGTDEGTLFSNFPVGTLLNDAGQMAFNAGLIGPNVDATNDRGLWSHINGDLTLVAREGGMADGLETGAVYAAFGSPLLNGQGELAFTAGLSGAGISPSNRSGLWVGLPENLSLIARKGEPAPGTEQGTNFSAFSLRGLNDAGQSAFSAILRDVGVNDANDTGLWALRENQTTMIAREGHQAPGADAGISFAGFNNSSNAVINRDGRLAFSVGLVGPGVDEGNDSGLWSEGLGDLSLVAKEGDQAPGTDVGVNFSGFSNFVLNGSGQMAFRARLIGEGVTNANDEGIWAQDLSGGLTLIVREGDALEVLPGDMRVVDGTTGLGFVGMSANEDGQSSGFNDLGLLTFSANFSDGSSGIFTSDAVLIPEPSSLILAGLAFLGLLTYARRSRRFF